MSRILIMTPQLPHPPQSFTGRSQGTTIRNFNLIARLARRHTIDLLTFGEPTPVGPDAAPIDELALLRPYCRQIVTETPPVRTLSQRGRDTLFSALPDMALRLESPAMHAQLARLLREDAYDVIQVEGIEMAPYALRWRATAGLVAAAANRSRPRLVFDDHNAEYLLQKRAFTTDVRRPRRWLAAAYSLVQWHKLARYERRICRAADGVAVVSDADYRALEALVPGLDAIVVPNGVDLDFYRPGVVPPMSGLSTRALVFTGKMDYRPNVDAVLWFTDAVLPRILAQIPDAHFYVVGQQPHARLAHLGDHPAVTLTGRVPDVRPYIVGAGVFVVPLRIGGGTRLKVLEAMALGQALVSTRLGCDGFPFEDDREVCFADDPPAFADAVVALLRDRERAAALGRAARAYVEAHFGWDAIVPLLEGLYP